MRERAAETKSESRRKEWQIVDEDFTESWHFFYDTQVQTARECLLCVRSGNLCCGICGGDAEQQENSTQI